MDEIGSGLSTEVMAELCALADGTLPAERRAAVEARVAASPELQEILKRQRLALAAVDTLADEQMPPSLRAQLDEKRARRPKS